MPQGRCLRESSRRQNNRITRRKTPTNATRGRQCEISQHALRRLALAGKVSSDLLQIIRARPKLFADLLRELKSLPDHAVIRLVREVRDGNW